MNGGMIRFILGSVLKVESVLFFSLHCRSFL